MTTPEVEALIAECRNTGPSEGWERIVRSLAKERDAAYTLLKEAVAACSCGCPMSEHENYDDGYSCAHYSHDCVPCPPAVATMLAAARAKVERLRTICEAVAQEAHTMGRVYARGGEKLNPAEEFERVSAMVRAALAETEG